ncbi:UNVERIFIED_CONTAM: hypothetical protein GTU68_029885 [Idotea baltica]|nr:hypothetical protein [Idotea baltica]
MKFKSENLALGSLNYAIVDEVDSVLIDEARTPLIISGAAEDSTELYVKINKIAHHFESGKDFEIELQSKQLTLTEDGVARGEELLKIDNLYDPSNIALVHHLQQALKAHNIFEKNVDYLIKNGEVIIVDEFTGRQMPGRRWSDGLHQAVEAKEGMAIARENQTIASITYQNFFRLYGKLSGMTGTAVTEAAEFNEIYKLAVIVIPTNKPLLRDDESDVVFRTTKEKIEAVVEDIEENNENGQPVLVGTISIEQSETYSQMLSEKGISHTVLNAKHHESEAEIVSQAGRLGGVTIATNMAGRGTDIVLGGNPEDAGGLFIMGTERHESRRIDNQLRGRSGRQGDPGLTRFYISLEDDLMKRFGGDKIQGLMKSIGWQEGVAMDGRLISRAIENAQSKVERLNFDRRKEVTKYDDVMNKQRQAIYSLRKRILLREDLETEFFNFKDDLVEDAVLNICTSDKKPINWNLDELSGKFEFLFNKEFKFDSNMQLDQQKIFDLLISITERSGTTFDFTFDTYLQHKILENIDKFWLSHLQQMDFLREGVGLRSYGQKNPLHEYQREGFNLFTTTLDQIKEKSIRDIFYLDATHFDQMYKHIQAELRRREALKAQLDSVNQSSESSDGSPRIIEAKDPESQKQKIQARKRARRKKKK